MKIFKKLRTVMISIFTFNIIKSLIKTTFFCKHDITYYDIKLLVEDTEQGIRQASPHLYDKINGNIWRDRLCHCKKCGIKKIKSMKIDDFGKWLNYDFEIPKIGSVVEVEIVIFGSETKRQKRDRILRNILD